MRVKAALALVDDLHGAEPPRAEQRRDAGRPRPLAHAVEELALLHLVAVDELLVREQVAVRVDDALRQAGRAGGVVELRRVVGRGVDARRTPDRRSRAARRRGSGSGRAARATGVRRVGDERPSGRESLTRWRMPSSPYRTDIESRIAPALNVPKNAAAVSGVGGSSIATRSPRSYAVSAQNVREAVRPLLQLTPADLADRALEVLVDHRELVGRVLVAAVGGDVVSLRHAPLVRRDGILVRPDLQCHRSSSTDLTG